MHSYQHPNTHIYTYAVRRTNMHIMQCILYTNSYINIFIYFTDKYFSNDIHKFVGIDK